MTEKKSLTSPTRREFFKTASLGTAAAAGMATGLVPGAAAATESAAKPESQGYRETEHVKRYYDLAKSF